LKSVRIPAEICLDLQKNPSPLGALPMIKQGLEKAAPRFFMAGLLFFLLPGAVRETANNCSSQASSFENICLRLTE